jgi:protocatechuate 3,4-dioxygenase beta subunit
MPAEQNRLITRRRGLALLATGGTGLWVAGSSGLDSAFARSADGDDYVADAARACTLTAEQEEGPFYVALDDVRDEIVLGQVGIPLAIQITIINSKTCKPIKHAAVDIWHCNASGVYSDISSEQTLGRTYLRGVQFTDKHGRVIFKSIFPGHYSGRTAHIHARIHINATDSKNKLVGGHICHTGQMFPPEAVYREVFKLAPYDAETAAIVSHAEDRVWTQQHGYEGLMKFTQAGHKLSKGLIGSVTMAVNPSATPALIGATSGGPSGPTGTPP